MSNKRVCSLAAACCALSLSPFAATLADEAPIEEGERCLSSRSISRTEVIDDQNVLFFIRGSVIYLNHLPKSCSRLALDRRFIYETSVGRLCESDHITVLRDGGFAAVAGRTCRLGRFHPISREQIQALMEPPELKPEPLPPAEPEEPEQPEEPEEPELSSAGIR